MPVPDRDRGAAEQAILELLAPRGAGRTICPSEAARALGGGAGFRPLIGLVREAAGTGAADPARRARDRLRHGRLVTPPGSSCSSPGLRRLRAPTSRVVRR